MKRKGLSWLIVLLLPAAFLLGKRWYMQPAFAEGETAADFSAQLLNGESFQLSDWNDYYVLLDFWGSWCGPCRRENPAIRELYDTFHDRTFAEGQGFIVVNIGVDQSRTNLLKAIERDGLVWPYHIQDPTSSYRFFDAPIANLYGVKQLPSNFLIAPGGTIVARNQTPGQIGEMLRKRLVD